jgi:hypothetical protein
MFRFQTSPNKNFQQFQQYSFVKKFHSKSFFETIWHFNNEFTEYQEQHQEHFDFYEVHIVQRFRTLKHKKRQKQSIQIREQNKRNIQTHNNHTNNSKCPHISLFTVYSISQRFRSHPTHCAFNCSKLIKKTHLSLKNNFFHFKNIHQQISRIENEEFDSILPFLHHNVQEFETFQNSESIRSQPINISITPCRKCKHDWRLVWDLIVFFGWYSLLILSYKDFGFSDWSE